MVTEYSFRVSAEENEDGRWSAWLTSYPACGTWGYTRKEAVKALEEMAFVFMEVMEDCKEPVHGDEVCEILVSDEIIKVPVYA